MTDDHPSPDEHEPGPERPMFAHPDWMVGIVLIFAVVALFAGLENPIWLLIGSPFILVLIVYIWARFTRSRNN